MHHRIMKPFQLAAVCVLASVIAGCTIIAPPSANKSDPAKKTKPAAASTKPKSPKASKSPVGAPAISPFVSLSNYLAGLQGTITAAVYDKRTGKTWVFHPGISEDTASIVKVEIMGTAMWNAEKAGTPLSASYKALIQPMIEISDNDAATQMYANVGGAPGVLRFDRAAGLTQTAPSSQQYIPGTTLPGWGLTTTTARDEVTLVSKFAYQNRLLSPGNRSYGLRLMRHIEAGQDWGVSGGVPAWHRPWR